MWDSLICQNINGISNEVNITKVQKVFLKNIWFANAKFQQP